MSRQVSVEVVIDDGPHAGPGRHTVLRLSWSEADPFAVRLRLTALPDHPALPRGQWVVLRDFLLYGLTVPTGDGSVRIRPDPVRDRVWLELDRPGRPACISVPLPVVASFLAQTEAVVPWGEERTSQALETLLDKLFYSS